MAPMVSPSERDRERVGPHPSYIEIAKPYILQSRIQKCLVDVGMSDAKEDAARLQGVAWIDQVRRALQLPIRTFNTAVIYYHKFRLLHSDTEYNWADASAAALFTACKIEDTLKKSREILCANWNLKVGPGESLSSDDPRFDNHSKLIIGLERLMLESAGFDFRNRYPQKLMVKLARALGFDRNKVSRTAWNLSIDLYRTLAPLKQSTPTLAIACIELAARLHDMDTIQLVDACIIKYGKWATSRAEVMETLLDLLDLYTHHRGSTAVGPSYTLEAFIDIRIGLNQEASAANIPRYTHYASDTTSEAQHASNGIKARNGFGSTSPYTPATPGTVSPGNAQAPTSAIGIRGQNGTVRFMLDAARARDERNEVDKFHKIEEEEYEVEVSIENRPDDRDKRSRDNQDHQELWPQAHESDLVSELSQQPSSDSRTLSYWDTFRKRPEVTGTTSNDNRNGPESPDEDRIDAGRDFGAQQGGSHDHDCYPPENSRPPHHHPDEDRWPMASPPSHMENDYKRPRRRGRGFYQESSYDPWADDEVGQRKHRKDFPHNSRRTRESSVSFHDACEVGQNSHRGRGRGRARRGGARGGHGDYRRETSYNDHQRRHSTVYDEHTSGYVDHYDSRAFARDYIDSYRPSRDVPRESRAEDHYQSGVGQSQQCSPLQSIEDLDRYDHLHQAGLMTGARSVDKLEERDTRAQAKHYNAASSVHPDRSLLMSPINDESRQCDLDNPPSEVTDSQVILKQAYGRPTPDLTPSKSRSRSPHRAVHPQPTAPRSVNRGLSAEDGHQWARDPETNSRGRSKNRGRGHARGHGRGSRGQDSRRDDGRKERGDGDRADRARSPRSPRPHEQSRKKMRGD